MIQGLLLVFALVLWAQAPLAVAADCTKTSEICSDSTPCKSIGGVPICLADMGQTCWTYDVQYTCIGEGLIDDCQALRDRGCGQVGSRCVIKNQDGTCSMYEQSYQCVIKEGTKVITQDCGPVSYCIDGGACFNVAKSGPDPDFVKAATALEAMREGALYKDPNSLVMFEGKSENCAKGFFGLKNCCKEAGGAQSNGGVMSGILFQGVIAGGKAAINVGSRLAFDFMFPDMSKWFDSGAKAVYGSNTIFDSITGALKADPIYFNPTNFNPSFSFFGFTASWAPPTGNPLIQKIFSIDTAFPLNGSSLLDGLIAPGTGYLSFDPTSLAIQVGMQMIMEMLACDPDDQMLAMHRGANLCHFVGSWCSNELNLVFAKICLETTEEYCCYNSKLARIINEQGRSQVGKTWGDCGEGGCSPDCSGFTTAQFEKLDFSQMNLGEFANDILSNMAMPNSAQVGAAGASAANKKVQQFLSH